MSVGEREKNESLASKRFSLCRFSSPGILRTLIREGQRSKTRREEGTWTRVWPVADVVRYGYEVGVKGEVGAR